MSTHAEPSILPGCSVLAPMEVRRDEAHRPNAPRTPKAKAGGRERGSRFASLNAFVDFTMRDLTRAETLVWLALYRDTKPDGVARTSQADLARRVGANVCTIKRAVAALVHQGLLTVVCRGNLRRGPSAYRVHPITKENLKGARAPPS
ncbi:MAG TPA: hypothetical protein VGJ26_21790 [Pirellulales bacterium]|jgi:hypothetical protein